MKNIFLLLLMTFVVPAVCQTKPDLQNSINKDLKILNLSPSSFWSNNKDRITHDDVITEIKRNFTIDENIFESANLNEYLKDEIKIRTWIFNDHEDYQRIKESTSEVYINDVLYNFTLYVIEKKEPSIALEYFTEKNYGLISYTIKDKTINIKRKSKSPRLQKKFEEMYVIKKKMKNAL